MCTQVSYVYVAAEVNERVNLWVFFLFFFSFFGKEGGGVGDSSKTPIWNEKGLSLSLLSQRKSKNRSSYYRETYVEYSKSVNSGCINQAVGLSKYTIFILSQLSDDILSDGVGKRLRYQGSKRFEKERKASSYWAQKYVNYISCLLLTFLNQIYLRMVYITVKENGLI